LTTKKIEQFRKVFKKKKIKKKKERNPVQEIHIDSIKWDFSGEFSIWPYQRSDFANARDTADVLSTKKF